MSAEAADRLQVCVFLLAGRLCAVRLTSVVEIAPMAALAEPPGMPAILQGLLTLGRQSIPVLKLAGLFGLPPVPLGLHTPLVIVRDPSGPLALLVNQVIGIGEGSRLVAAADRDSFNGCVEGQVAINGGLVHLLSLDRLILEKERQRLVEFRAAVARRVGQFEDAPA